MEVIEQKEDKYILNIDNKEKLMLGLPPFSYEEDGRLIIDLSNENISRNFDEIIYQNKKKSLDNYKDIIGEHNYNMLLEAYNKKIYLYKKDNYIYIKTPFEKKDDIKKIPSRRWNPDDKVWYINDNTDNRMRIEELFDIDIEIFLGKSKENEISEQIIKDFPDLFDHQVKAVGKALVSMAKYKGFLVAHTTGTGKTYISFVCAHYMLLSGIVDKVVVLTTASNTIDMKKELEKRDIEGFVIKEGKGSKIVSIMPDEFDILVTSHTTFKNIKLYKKFFNIKTLIILDEASVIKDKKNVYKELKKLRKENPNVYILSLTATPVENNLIDIFNILNITTPGFLEYYEFINRFCNMKEIFIRGGEKRRVIDRENFRNIDDFKKRIQDVYDRKLSEEILDLPKENIITYFVKLTKNQQLLKEIINEVFDDLKFKNRSEKGILSLKENSLLSLVANSPYTLMMNLKENHIRDNYDEINEIVYQSIPKELIEFYSVNDQVSKLKVLKVILSESIKTNDKVIIFTKYEKVLQALEEFLNKEFSYINVLSVSGKVSAKNKDQITNDFNNFKSETALITTDTFSRGKNFQFCNILINYDLPWNPAVVRQRIGRINRIGSNDKKYIFNILSDPIERNIYEKIVNKEDQAIRTIEFNQKLAEDRRVIQDITKI